MVGLGTQVTKLEKKIAGQSQTGPLEDRVVYEPDEKDLAEAMGILIACGAVREVRS